MDILDDLQNSGLNPPESIGANAKSKSELVNLDPVFTEVSHSLVESEFPNIIPEVNEDQPTALEDQLSSGLDKLNKKYDLSEEIKSELASIDEIIENVDQYSKEKNLTTDLLQTKIIQVVANRQKAKGLLTLIKLTDAVQRALLNDISNARNYDIDYMESLSKVFEYQDRLDKMTKAYTTRTGIDESLEELKKSVQNKGEVEEIENLSHSDIQKIIKHIQNS